MNRVDAYPLIHQLGDSSPLEPGEDLRKMSKHPDVPCLRIPSSKYKRCTFHEIRRNIERVMMKIMFEQ